MLTLAEGLTPVPDEDASRTSYEIFVGSFADSNGDGIGDLDGIAAAMDYINDGNPATAEDLGATGIWLTPIFPSPTYHKYDASDYTSVDPAFGTLEDFDELLALCHERGVTLILDLAVNHTSVEHPWFKAAADYLRQLPPDADPVYEDCPYVWYYNFSRDPVTGYAPLSDSNWYYEARFWEGMPDMNLSTEAVREEIRSVAAFWLDRGVDGFRLDACTSYYSDQTEANVDFLTWLNSAVKEIKPEAYLVGEVWADQSVYARYLESGIDSVFDFRFAGQEGIIAMTVKGQKGADVYAREMAAEEELYAQMNPAYVNAPFYTNHDMARSAGYYAYDDGSRTKLAGALNLLQTGNAFIYYGEELGMKGAGIDENKRAPMDWTRDGESGAEALGYDEAALKALMTAGPENMESFSMKFPSLAGQTADDESVLTYYRTAVRIRESFPVIARGRTTVLDVSGGDVCAFTRTDEDGKYAPVLIAVNTSEENQWVQLGSLAEEYPKLLAVLTVSGSHLVSQSGSNVVLPPLGIAILGK